MGQAPFRRAPPPTPKFTIHSVKPCPNAVLGEVAVSGCKAAEAYLFMTTHPSPDGVQRVYYIITPEKAERDGWYTVGTQYIPLTRASANTFEEAAAVLKDLNPSAIIVKDRAETTFIAS